MKCEICGRKAKSGFCKLHEEARRNLIRTYDAWKKSMGISWAEYLKEIQRNPYAGDWTKEVAKHLLTSDLSIEKAESPDNAHVGG
jgi:hypothetical protein